MRRTPEGKCDGVRIAAAMAIALSLVLPAASAAQANGQTCTSMTVSSTGVSFTYDPFATSAVQVPLTLYFNCKAPTVDLSSGQRTMTSPTDQLPYRICVDAACATPWPEGTAAVQVVKDTAGGKSWTSTMYFQIDPRQDVSVGSYGATITITLMP